MENIIECSMVDIRSVQTLGGKETSQQFNNLRYNLAYFKVIQK